MHRSSSGRARAPGTGLFVCPPHTPACDPVGCSPNAVPQNVRLNAAQTLRRLMPLIDPVSLEGVKSSLSTLSNDDDADVRFFASQGLQG